MINSSSLSQSSSYSDARAKPVMDKVFEDFTALVVCGLTTTESILKWKTDLLYLLKEEVVVFFEVQFIKLNGEVPALRYYVKSDFSLTENALSGRLNELYGLPTGTTANLYVDMNSASPNYLKANEELHANRGWGYGKSAEGEIEKHHAYSHEAYGVDRNKIGKWN